MKKVKKFIKILTIAVVFIVSAAILSGICFYYATTYGVNLDDKKIEESICTSSLKIYDKTGNKINLSSENYIPITKLSKNTKNAFICAEDKRFYSHKGIDYIRMIGATLTNLKTRSFSQGASTISQQFIKNTQLTSEKTIKRKLKEIKLTKQLEKKYTKDQILEMYLNNIYFGNGCYGIENAAKHYFNKSAANLTLSESALLASTINAPSVYDIENNTEKAKARRNLILNLMNSYGKITNIDLKKAQSENVNLSLTKLANNNYIYSEIIDEACRLTKKTENELKNSNLTITTYIDGNLENNISSIIKNNYSNLPSNPNIATIVIDNKTNGIVSIYGNNTSLKTQKQPGSLIKPILVYGAGFEHNKISPATKVLDEPININGYSPENADKKYHGAVSIRESLKNSYNIPAVKLLNEIGVKNAQAFAEKLGITFDENDNNLAIALGGFTKGTTLKELADAYAAIANFGDYSKSKYISKITQNQKVIYTDNHERTNKISSSTCYLLTDILKDATKSGTAKRLKNFSFDLASKTGTVGSSSSSKNLESYNVSYTSAHTILTYIGGTVMQKNINGATYPTMLAKDILNELYKYQSPQDFKVPNTIEKVNINKNEYENNNLIQTDDKSNSITEIFSKNNLPQKNNSSIIKNLNVINESSKKPILCFFANKNCIYHIHKITENKDQIIETINSETTIENYKFEDKSAKSNEICEYFVEICEKSNNNIHKTNTVKLKAF